MTFESTMNLGGVRCGTQYPIVRAFALVIACAFAPLTFAQELQEIVVSATKRETDLQKTAISVSAFSDADLEASQSLTISDIAMRAPGLYVGGDNSLGSNPVAIRGIGSINLSMGADEAVGIYIDGVYQGRPYTGMFQFIDVEDVEILRGPQGTLYGRNATGGAILINTTTPDQNLVTKADFTISELNGFKGRALVSGPLIEGRLFGKIAVGKSRRDGYSVNPLTGQKLNGSDDQQATAALRWLPDDRWDVALRFFHGTNGSTAAAQNVLNGLPIDVIPATWPNETSREYTGVSLNASAELGGMTFASVTGYTEARTRSLTASANVGLTQYRDRTATEQWYQEFRLASAETSLFTWIMGVNAFHEKTTGRTDFVQFPLGLNFYNDLETTSYAAFLEAGYRFAERLHVTAGVRYTRDEKDLLNCFLAGGYTNILVDWRPDLCDGLYSPDARRWNEVTPRFVLGFDVSDNVYAYASATKGFRSGGWNYTQPVAVGSGFDPEYVWSYEVGVKSELLDRRLRVNLSSFVADYTDLQVRTLDPFINLFGVKNAATGRIEGVDLEIVARPTGSLSISANLSWLDAKYTEFSYEQPDGTVVDYAGNRLNYAPEWQLGLVGEYTFALPGGATLTPRVETSYSSDIFFNETNQAPYVADSHETINVRLRYEAPSGAWGAQLFVDNLTDHRTPLYAYNGANASIVAVIFGPPRVAGLQLYWKGR